MQKLYIDNVLSKTNFIADVLANNDELALDFSNVNDVSLEDIEKLLDLQKLAVFNELKIKIENMQPNVTQIFQQTGLYKLVDSFHSTSTMKINKRMGLITK